MFVGVQGVLKMSSRHVLKMYSIRLQRNNSSSSKLSWRRLEDDLKKSCKDVVEEEKLLRWRRVEDVTCWGHVFKASRRHVLKTFWTHVSKKSSRRLVKKQNVYWGHLYLMNLNKYLRNLYFPNLYPTKLR